MASREEILERIETLSGKHERLIAQGFMEMIQRTRDLASLEQIAEALTVNPASVVDLFRDDAILMTGDSLAAAIGGTAIAGAQMTANLQDPVRNPDGVRVEFIFNQANPRIAEYADEVAARRVREVTNDVRAVIREVVRDETLRGENPLNQARRIRQSIGLTARQERAVSNYRRLLEERPSEALRRELRDRRFDPTIRRAVREKKPLSQEQIDRMVERYRAKYLRYRSETIGRTEAIRTLSGANERFLTDQVRQGRIDARQIIREWVPTFDDKLRSSHAAIPRMNPEGVGLREAFQSPLGPIMFPGDPNTPAELSINCRCAVFNRVLSPELVGL